MAAFTGKSGCWCNSSTQLHTRSRARTLKHPPIHPSPTLTHTQTPKDMKGEVDCNSSSEFLVSTYVVCERLSVMHEPAGVVENLVQILQNTPIL